MKYKDQSQQPQIVIPKDVDVLNFNTVKSPSGAVVHYVESTELDVVRISVVFRAGVRYQSHPFTASATVNMLAEGTTLYTSEQLSETLDYYGIYYNTSVDRDYSIVTVCCLSKFLAETLSFLEEILTSPTFPENELEIYASKRKQSLAIQRTKVDVMAAEAFWKAIYGEKHPYGYSSEASEYDTLTSEHLKDFFNKYYTLDNSFTVISGKLKDDVVEKVLRVVDKLPRGERATGTIPSAVSVTEMRVDKKDAVQSAIRIGRALFPSNHPDYVTMQVIATILGGYFSSRLVQNLREDKGYTYGAFAQVNCLEESGYFVITTQVASEYTQASIDEIFKEIDIIKNELVSEEELNMVKSVMIGEMMRILDGPFGICDVTIENLQNNTDNRHISDIVNKINNTTPEMIIEAANKYLNDLSLVVVGRE